MQRLLLGAAASVLPLGLSVAPDIPHPDRFICCGDAEL